MRFFFTSPAFSLSGVNTAAANLVRGLSARGHEARILLTAPSGPDEMPMPPEPGIPLERLPVSRRDSWRRRWKVFVDYLSERSPCVYVPGYDWAFSRACPRLPDSVLAVGVVHSDEAVHYDHAKRLGACWNRVVAVSRAVAEKTGELCPGVRERIRVIPSGVDLPAEHVREGLCGRPLRVVYTGRLVQHQKRVLDLAALARGLSERGVDFTLSVVGGGPQEGELRRALAPFLEDGRARMAGTVENGRVLEILKESDVFVLCSDFEGQPVSLLEAMAAGCVPVVTRVRSGVPELVEDGVSGFLIPPGDVSGFCGRIGELSRDPALLAGLSRASRQAVAEGGFSIESVAGRYEGLCEEAFEDVSAGRFRRLRGRIAPPPFAGEGRGGFSFLLGEIKARLPFPGA